MQAVGFTTAGITGGSMAASMMSAAATAQGGSVAAGSLVAACQSVGATGSIAYLGAAGACVPLAGALFLGGFVYWLLNSKVDSDDQGFLVSRSFSYSYG